MHSTSITHRTQGIPESVRQAILNAGFTEEQVMADPTLVKDLLYTLDLEEVISGARMFPSLLFFLTVY